MVFKTLESALEQLSAIPLKDQVENIWIIGGASVYKVNQHEDIFQKYNLFFIDILFTGSDGTSVCSSHLHHEDT